MTTRRRFTKEEDRLILSTVAKNPHNLSECFREVATKINRSPKLYCKQMVSLPI